MRRRVRVLTGGLALTVALGLLPAVAQAASGVAPGCCGDAASWATGNKSALGTAAGTGSSVWFTVADGVTSEVFYPRADVPNTQDMQYVVTDGSTFTDLERDATEHEVSMVDGKSLSYRVTNTAKNGKYRITNDYAVDPKRNTLLINTRFESLDGGQYKLFLLHNPSLAGGGANDDARWQDGALVASGSEKLFGDENTSVASALTVNGGFSAHTNGYTGSASDCAVDLRDNHVLDDSYDGVEKPGNTVQCGQIDVGVDSTFTVGLGFGADAAAATGAAKGSLSDGYQKVSDAYRAEWNSYVDSLKPPPASVSGDDKLRAAYNVAVLALHAAEDKTHRGASVASLATPWGNATNGDALNDGYHRVWGRDLYQQASGLLAAGDTAQARRMAEFMWNHQYIGAPTQGDGTTYPAGSFPRYSPVSGVAGASPSQLGCCEQLDQAGFAIVLAKETGLTDADTYTRIKTAANHIRDTGPATTERWEEQAGVSPSSVAAEVAGLLSAADIARTNGDEASATAWESTADSWRNSLRDKTFTSSGHWGEHSYFERLDVEGNPNDEEQICFQEGCFFERDIPDFGFLDLVRLGLRAPDDKDVAASIAPTEAARDGNAPMRVQTPNGDVYFHRYPHDNYGDSNADCSGWPANGAQRFGRLWPVLSGERGEYEVANGRPAEVYLRSMADATNDGNFVPEQVWDRSDVDCYGLGRPTGSAAPLMWAEGGYLRLANAMDAGKVSVPSAVDGRYR